MEVGVSWAETDKVRLGERMSKAAMAHARQDEMDMTDLNFEDEDEDAILWMVGYV